ncbi:STAS domain-containing protein [Xanthobacter sediminis]
MKIETSSPAPDIAFIVLSGRLDIAGAAQVEGEFGTQASKARVVTVDLSGTPYLVTPCLASIGIRLLLANAKAQGRRGGGMLPCGCAPQVEQVLRLTGVDHLITLVPTRDGALAAAGRIAPGAATT